MIKFKGNIFSNERCFPHAVSQPEDTKCLDLEDLKTPLGLKSDSGFLG